MIFHLERVVQRVLEIIGGWMFGLAITVVVALAAMAFLGLNLYKFDRETCLSALRRLGHAASRGWGWLLASGVLLLLVWAMTELRQGLMERLGQQDHARYIHSQDPGGLPTTQRAPRISFLETTTRTQRIVIPPQISSLLCPDASGSSLKGGTLAALPGWSPEEARYGGRPAVNVQDELVKDDKTVILNRTIEVQRYVPMKLLRSDVELRLNFKESWQRRGGQVYRADFNGRYTFRNPFSEPRRLHFSFPLPDNSGTLSGFRFKVNGREMPALEVDRGLDWEGEVKPQEQAVVEIGYSHQGARAWSYDVGGRREPIADFHLVVRSDKADVKFLRGSLYPTRTESGLLDWTLQSQITSQNISLFFPTIPTEQILGSLFVFAPVAVVGLGTLVVVWSRLRRTGTSPWSAVLALLACCGGYALTSYLVGYMPPAAALLIAFPTSAALQWQALGSRLWVPVAVTTLSPFTFLAAGDTGLMLTLLGLATLSWTTRETIASHRLRPEDDVVPLRH